MICNDVSGQLKKIKKEVKKEHPPGVKPEPMPSPSPAPPVFQQHDNSGSINAIYQAAQASKARDRQLLKKAIEIQEAIHGIVVEAPVIDLTSIESEINSICNEIKSICNEIHTAPLIALTVERIAETTKTIAKTTDAFMANATWPP